MTLLRKDGRAPPVKPAAALAIQQPKGKVRMGWVLLCVGRVYNHTHEAHPLKHQGIAGRILPTVNLKTALFARLDEAASPRDGASGLGGLCGLRGGRPSQDSGLIPLDFRPLWLEFLGSRARTGITKSFRAGNRFPSVVRSDHSGNETSTGCDGSHVDDVRRRAESDRAKEHGDRRIIPPRLYPAHPSARAAGD
jgi:hypothetical protein